MRSASVNLSVVFVCRLNVVLPLAQVADLGLSRQNDGGKTVATKTCGRITHAAPELNREGRLSPAAGVSSCPLPLVRARAVVSAMLLYHVADMHKTAAGSVPPHNLPHAERQVKQCNCTLARQRR